jgi:hypothetical protein
MATKFSGFKTKSRSFPNVSYPAPPLSSYYNSAGVKQFDFACGAAVTAHTRGETITYTNHVKGEPYRDNRCVHVKSQFDYMGSPLSSHQVFDIRPGFEGNYYTTYCQHSKAIDAHTAAVGTALTALGVPTGAAVLAGSGQGYVNDAFQKAQPDLTTVSVPNFLAELSDLRSLLALWSGRSGLVKNLAGLRLNYQFGWKPTIGDIANMLNSVTSFEQKLRLFRESLGAISNRNYLQLNRNIQKSGNFNLGDVHYRVDWTASLSGRVKVHLKFRYEPLKVMTDTETNIRGLLDVLGFELNPRIIWDALPFTFVIDWFFGVGNWLQNFKVDTLELPIHCLDASVSYKEVLKVESRLTVNPTGYPTDNTSTEVMDGCVSTSEFFERQPFLPDAATLSGLGWRKPSMNQLINLVSLAAVLGGK